MEALSLPRLKTNLLYVHDVVTAHGSVVFRTTGAYSLPTQLFKILDLCLKLAACKERLYITRENCVNHPPTAQHDTVQSIQQDYNYTTTPPALNPAIPQHALQARTDCYGYNNRKLYQYSAPMPVPSKTPKHTTGSPKTVVTSKPFPVFLHRNLQPPTAAQSSLRSARLHQWHLVMNHVN